MSPRKFKRGFNRGAVAGGALGSMASESQIRGNDHPKDVAAAALPTTSRQLPEHLWTTTEAARFLRVSTKTLRRLTYYHDLPCVRLASRLRFIPADVLAWARRRKEV